MSAPEAHLSRRYRFSASHRLHVRHFGDERNRAIFGKCNNPYGHGHNYFLQVTYRGPIDPVTGMVVDLGALDSFVRGAVLERFDQANLNCDSAFARCTPSTENLALELWRAFRNFHAGSALLYRLRLEETGNNAFDFYGEREPLLTSGSDWEPGRRTA